MKAASNVDFLKGCLVANPLFAELSPATLDQIARVTRLVSFAPEAPIAAHEEEMTFSGVIVSGGIRNSVTNVDGYEFSMSILGRGAYYGVIGLVEPTLSPYDCVTHGPTEIAMIANRDFRALLRHQPELAILAARAMQYRLRKAYGFMVNQLLDNLDRRLRRTLIMLANSGSAAEGGVPEISITQELLGNFVQSSRPSVNKALRELEREGTIEIGYSVIRILDMKALAASFEGETILTL